MYKLHMLDTMIFHPQLRKINPGLLFLGHLSKLSPLLLGISSMKPGRWIQICYSEPSVKIIPLQWSASWIQRPLGEKGKARGDVVGTWSISQPEMTRRGIFGIPLTIATSFYDGKSCYWDLSALISARVWMCDLIFYRITWMGIQF